MAGGWKFLGTLFSGLTLVAATTIAGPPPAPSDEDLLAFSLKIQGCVGVVQVLKRTVDAGEGGEYTEYLDVKPMRWFSGTCAMAKTRLYSRPHSQFGFLSTGDWEVGPRDTVIVFTYRDKNRSYISQTPHTLWNGLAKATQEKTAFLEANVPRILDSLASAPRDSKK